MKNGNLKKGFGECKLTREVGKFIDAHLIPKALTRPEAPGLPFFESGGGQKPKKRWSSWHDRELVTQSGENILTEFDTWAIPELRRLKLVWSGWGPMQALGSDHEVWSPFGHGIRKLQSTDNTKLRLFFLSVLWRSAATSRPEFAEVSINYDNLRKLGQMLIDKNPEPQSFFPISLTQISSLGLAHNLSPIRQSMTVPALTSNMVEHVVPIYRFYFDGLIFHVPTNPQTDEDIKSKGNLILGPEPEFIVATVPFERSFQLQNLVNIAEDTNRAMQDGIWRAENLQKAASRSDPDRSSR